MSTPTHYPALSRRRNRVAVRLIVEWAELPLRYRQSRTGRRYTLALARMEARAREAGR